MTISTTPARIAGTPHDERQAREEIAAALAEHAITRAAASLREQLLAEMRRAYRKGA